MKKLVIVSSVVIMLCIGGCILNVHNIIGAIKIMSRIEIQDTDQYFYEVDDEGFFWSNKESHRQIDGTSGYSVKTWLNLGSSGTKGNFLSFGRPFASEQKIHVVTQITNLACEDNLDIKAGLITSLDNANIVPGSYKINGITKALETRRVKGSQTERSVVATATKGRPVTIECDLVIKPSRAEDYFIGVVSDLEIGNDQIQIGTPIFYADLTKTLLLTIGSIVSTIFLVIVAWRISRIVAKCFLSIKSCSQPSE